MAMSREKNIVGSDMEGTVCVQFTGGLIWISTHPDYGIYFECI